MLWRVSARCLPRESTVNQHWGVSSFQSEAGLGVRVGENRNNGRSDPGLGDFLELDRNGFMETTTVRHYITRLCRKKRGCVLRGIFDALRRLRDAGVGRRCE